MEDEKKENVSAGHISRMRFMPDWRQGFVKGEEYCLREENIKKNIKKEKKRHVVFWAKFHQHPPQLLPTGAISCCTPNFMERVLLQPVN